MNRRWRWAIAAGVALTLAALLYVRLDTGRMQRILPPLVQRLTGASLRFNSLSFSLVHGLDVHLQQVRMRRASWSIDAPTALLELRVVPLLLGKIELSGIYLRSPVIRLAPRRPSKTGSVMEAHGLPRGLTLDVFSVSDATLMSESGQTWISGLDMDIQDIGPSRTMRWELQARTGEQTAVGHGQLSLRLGGIDGGFGKLTLDRIPLQALPSLVRFPGHLTPRLIHHGYDKLGTVLTLSIGHDDQWTLFGEAKVTGAGDRPTISLRGRAYRDARHTLGWRDTFLQIGDDATLAAEGGCTSAGVCSTNLRGRSIDLAPLSALAAPDTPPWQPASGDMDVQGNLRWQHGSWNLAAQTEMQGLSWKDAGGSFTMPDLHISDLLLASGDDGAVNLKSARIGFAKQSGSLLATGGYDPKARNGHLLLRLDALQDAWAPVLRLASMVDPAQRLDIGGTGIMQGDVRLSVMNGRPALRFSLDGTKSAIRIAGAAKPAGMAMVASGDWHRGLDDTALRLSRVRLGDADLQALRWQKGTAGQALDIGAIRLDMQALRKQGVRFPTLLHDFQGGIAGHLSTRWDSPDAKQDRGPWPGLAGLSGDLDLQHFGTARWQLSGRLPFDHGHATLARLQLTGAHGKARLDGVISFAKRTGDIDIRDGALAWNSGDALPAWLETMRLRGRIHGMDVQWLGQSWTGLTGWYQMHGQMLKLTNVATALADGRVTSPGVRFGFVPGGMTLQGTAQIGAMHVQKLAGLDTLLAGHPAGKTFATVKFDGRLPLAGWANWRSDGNIMIYGGRWRAQPDKGKVQAVHHFDLFGFRFRNRQGRISLSHIQYEDAGGRYAGDARLGPGGTLTGSVRRHQDGKVFTLAGPWPYLDLKAGSPAH